MPPPTATRRFDANPDRAGAGWPPAVIAGAYQTGVLGVRSLTRRGVHAVCFDCNPGNPGFRSVYGPARLCPNPDQDVDGWLRFMMDLAATFEQKPVLISSSDQFVSAVAQHAGTLRAAYLLSPGVALQGLLADKQTQYDLAARHGMPMPLTASPVTEDEVVAFAAQAMYPCLLKPTHFREWQRFEPGHSLYHQKVAIATSPDHLVSLYRQAAVVNSRVILQEIIEGPDTAKRVYLSCYDAGSRRIANAMFKELRCDPIGFGPASVTEPVRDEETDGICDRFLRSIGYAGICEIEMKRDTRDGQVKLIEANPRLSGGGDAAPYAGVDICWLHYLDLIGIPVTPVSPSDRDFRHVVLRADGMAVPTYWRAGLLSFGGVLRSYRPPLAFFDLDPRDWRYSLLTVKAALGAFLKGVLARRAS
jgi:D-aspartate ligase